MANSKYALTANSLHLDSFTVADWPCGFFGYVLCTKGTILTTFLMIWICFNQNDCKEVSFITAYSFHVNLIDIACCAHCCIPNGNLAARPDQLHIQDGSEMNKECLSWIRVNDISIRDCLELHGPCPRNIERKDTQLMWLTLSLFKRPSKVKIGMSIQGQTINFLLGYASFK